jgi:hypothetical protein
VAKQKLGDCFVAACRAFEHLRSQGHDPKLVHGYVIGQVGYVRGLRYPHAWVEVADGQGRTTCIDRSNGRDISLPKDLYYLIGQIVPEHCRQYDAGAVLRMQIDTRTYGPWELDPDIDQSAIALKRA